MKIRSTALREYLRERGLLDASPEDSAVITAKADYRRKYKNQWKKNKIPKRELRPDFSLREYADLKVRAKEMDITPTAYIRLLTLDSLTGTATIPNKGKLEKILQLVSMATIALLRSEMRGVQEYVSNAETLLLEYLNKR